MTVLINGVWILQSYVLLCGLWMVTYFAIALFSDLQPTLLINHSICQYYKTSKSQIFAIKQHVWLKNDLKVNCT